MIGRAGDVAPGLARASKSLSSWGGSLAKKMRPGNPPGVRYRSNLVLWCDIAALRQRVEL